MDEQTRHFIRQRAKDCCEYCRIPQHAIPAPFHVEHIWALQHAPADSQHLNNLALACDRCNLHKGPNLSSIDPKSQLIVSLFHPRQQLWDQHFYRDEEYIFGSTPCGRATAKLLQMNHPRRIELRKLLLELHEWPE